jgi:hypothetical protein
MKIFGHDVSAIDEKMSDFIKERFFDSLKKKFEVYIKVKDRYKVLKMDVKGNPVLIDIENSTMIEFDTYEELNDFIKKKNEL